MNAAAAVAKPAAVARDDASSLRVLDVAKHFVAPDGSDVHALERCTLNVAAGEMVSTELQPIVQGSTMAVDQADSYIRTGKTGVSQEKQAIDCVLITKDNAAKLHDFKLSQ